jgi:hypothetical protein
MNYGNKQNLIYKISYYTLLLATLVIGIVIAYQPTPKEPPY